MDAIGGERRCRSVASLYRGAAHGRFGVVSLLLCLSFATCCMANTNQKVYNYAKGGDENWNWIPPRRLYQANYGTNTEAMTLMLVGYNRTDPSHHFVAIRQHNLAVDKRYMLKAELNCLLNYSKGPDTIAPESGVHTKWYRNGQRIRKDRLETYLFSLTGEDRSILSLTDFQDNMNHTEELNGEYVCAVYDREGLLIVKKTFDVKIFYPPELNGFDRRPLIEEMAKKVSVPKTGVISVLAKGLSWVTLGWKLQVVHLKYNVANVTKIIIQLTGAASNPTPTEIDNPAEEGQVNITGLDQDQAYKIRSKTYNGPNHSSTGRREEFRTDLLPSVECENTTLTVVAGSNQTVECLIRGRPQPDMELQRFDVDSLKTLQNKKIAILSWSNMHYGIVRPFTCFDVWNEYDRIRTCIQKIIYCRPLPVPKNGFAKVLDGLTPNGKTIFSCKEGFFLNGTYERQCVHTTSKWDQHQPTCLAHTSPTAEIKGGPYLFMSAGKQVQFNCKVTGVPPPQVKWYVNGDEIEIERRLPYQTKVFVDSQDLKKLHVRASVRVDMDYNVTCTASNELGSAESQAMLIMAGTTEKVDVYEHEEFSLTCLDLPDLQDVSWNDTFQVTTGNASIVLGPPAVRYNQSRIVCYNREVDNLKAYVINVLPAISSGFIDSRLRERFEPSLLEFGKNAVVSCRFRSKFPGLHAYWENLTIPGAQVYNYTVPGSSKFGIDVFRPEHEGKVTCVGSVAQGTATRTFTLKGVQRGHCELHQSNDTCGQFLGNRFVFWPELNGDGEPVTHSQVRELRNRVYLRLTEHLNVSESRACFDLVHRMICEYVYSPCDPSSVQYSDVRKSWKQPVCASDCYRARTEFCSAKWDGLILHIKSTDLNTTLGNDLDCSTPTAEDEDYVLRSQCVTSLRYARPTNVRNRDCVCGDGSNYAGVASVTHDQEQCVPWDPQLHSAASRPNSTYPWSATVANHCRNPEGRSSTPWCYTGIDTLSDCNIPRCSNDIEAQGCRKYEGNFCRDVSLIASHSVKKGAYAFLLERQASAADTMRDPYAVVHDLKRKAKLNTQCAVHLQRLMCLQAYTVCDRNSAGSCGQTRQVCTAYCQKFNAKCPVSPDYREKLKAIFGHDPLDCSHGSYDSHEHHRHERCIHVMDGFTDRVISTGRRCASKASRTVTKSNRPCQKWNFTLPHTPSPHINEYSLTDSRCRNPGGMADFTWCYTSDPAMRWERCGDDDDLCDEEVEASARVTSSTGMQAALGTISALIVLTVATVVAFVVYRRRRSYARNPKLSTGDFHPRSGRALEVEDSPPNGRKPSQRVGPGLKGYDPPLLVVRDNPEYWLTSPDLYGMTTLQHDKLEFSAQIAEGHFGKVWSGLAKDLVPGEDKSIVAIKTLKTDCNEQTERGFIREAQVISRFKHVNIIKLLGVCVPDGSSGQPLCLLFEYMEYGDLLHFLREAQRHRRPTIDMKGRNLSVESADSIHKDRALITSTSTEVSVFDKPLTTLDLCGMAAQVAHGMQYLSSRRYVHRDLAARNCLVGRNHVVKIADFGMSRGLIHRDYYRPQGNLAAMPVRWMPPEVIMYGKHTTESDIWSFGVLLWEIFTHGAVPYYDLSNEEVVKRVVEQNKRLPQPHECPPVIYGLMQECWFDLAEERPPFRRLWKALHTWRPPFGVGTSDYASGGTDSDLENISTPSDDVFDDTLQPTMVISPHGSRVQKIEPGRGSLTSPLLSQGQCLGGGSDSSPSPPAISSAETPPQLTPPLPYIPQSNSQQPLEEPSPEHNAISA